MGSLENMAAPGRCRVRERSAVHRKPFPKPKCIHFAFLTQGPAGHFGGERSRTCTQQSLPPKVALGHLRSQAALLPYGAFHETDHCHLLLMKVLLGSQN